MGCFTSKNESPNRTIHFPASNNHNQQQCCSNQIKSTKYNILTFLPLAILFQFLRVANFVYLVTAILQAIPAISSLNPFTAMAPLIVVLTVSIIREGVQDYKRHQRDKQINERTCLKIQQKQELQINWENVQEGDILKIHKEEFIPADLLMLYSSDEKGICYIETANLDGETNLKIKSSVKLDIGSNPQDFSELQTDIKVEQPHSQLYQFHGWLKNHGEQTEPLLYQNFLLRECRLKNTSYIIGIVLYVGTETKIIMNQNKKHPHKMSKMEHKVNLIQMALMLLLIMMAGSCSIAYGFHHGQYENRSQITYAPQKPYLTEITQSVFVFFSCFLLLSFLIPVSLNIALEVSKSFLGLFISMDRKFKKYRSDQGCTAANISIVEELGDVDYILSDKTGTLTRNQMVFKGISTKNGKFAVSQLQLEESKDHQFWEAVALCHDIVRDQNKDEYQGSSPDEVCFVDFAKKIEYQFIKRTKNELVIEIHSQKRVYQLLHMIPFSCRKRMSVVVRDLTQKSKNEITVLTKGADISMIPLLKAEKDNEDIYNNMNQFASEGLRTLIFAKKAISNFEFQTLMEQLKQLKMNNYQPEQHSKLQQQINNKFETDLKLLGGTAIQDRLQDRVPQTICRLRAAGIRVMMLTGDKLQTAESIGMLSKFINRHSQIVRLTADLTEDQIEKKAINALRNYKISEDLSLTIEGDAISKFISDPEKQVYNQLLERARSVIFCRSSPQEKAKIVSYIKETQRSVVLAIGDGGNDVAMIEQANIGVGIKGKEGNSAVSASDFSFTEFQHLDRLVLHHGRWCHFRLSYFFVYYGWKNLVMTFMLYYFLLESAWSGTPGFSQVFITAYNAFIGLILVIWNSFNQQDINDDTHKEMYAELPALYWEMKNLQLFSFKRYIIWSVSGGLISLLLYYFFDFTYDNSTAINVEGQPGDLVSIELMRAISLSMVVIIVALMDMHSFNIVTTVFAIGFGTIFGAIVYLFIENWTTIEGFQTRRHVLTDNMNLRFWSCIILVIGTTVAIKTFFNALYHQVTPTIAQQFLENYKQNGSNNSEISASKKRIYPGAMHTEVDSSQSLPQDNIFLPAEQRLPLK